MKYNTYEISRASLKGYSIVVSHLGIDGKQVGEKILVRKLRRSSYQIRTGSLTNNGLIGRGICQSRYRKRSTEYDESP